MKKMALLTIFIFMVQLLSGQNTSMHSEYALLYPVQAQNFKLYDYKYLKKNIANICKNAPVDTVEFANIQSYTSHFTQSGFYLLVYINNYNVKFELLGNFPWKVANVFSPIDGGIEITDSLHQPIKNLDVMFDIERMHYNPYHEVYIYSQTDQDGLLRISNGRLTQEIYLNTYASSYRNWGDGDANNSNNLTGFIATNQPKYKHGDTLKVKIYLCKENGKPHTQDIQLKIQQSYSKVVHSTQLKALTPGAYVYNYVITDSLTLDQFYNIQVFANTKKYPVLTNTFTLEDYELDEITYELNALHPTYYKDDSLYFQFDAYDKNRNTAFDAELDVVVTPYYIGNIYSKSVYFPDTLYQGNFKMQDLNEGIIQLPSWLKTKYPADYMLSIRATCRNSNNELKKINTSIQINQGPEPFQTYISNRHIHFSAEKELSDSIMVYRYTNFANPVAQFYIHKKDSLLIDAQSSAYLLSWNGQIKRINIDASLLNIGLHGQVKTDTLFISMSNPYDVPIKMYYYIDEKRHELKDTSEQYMPLKKNEQITVYYEYNAGGNKIISSRSFIINDKNVFIKSDLPDKVYPGLVTSLNISTTNYKNAPLENTNLTVLSINAAFTENNVPMVPTFGKTIVHPATSPKGSLRNKNLASYTALVDSAWVVHFGLQNKFYYQCINSKQLINVYREPKKNDGVKGSMLKIVEQNKYGRFYEPAFIEENNEVVYYNQSTTNHIKTTQGKHQYRMRLNDRYLDLPPVDVYEDSITYIIVKSNLLSPQRKKTKFDLLNEQAKLKDRFMLIYQNQYNSYPTFISNYKETYCLAAFTSGYHYLGPFTGADSAYVHQFYKNQVNFVTNSMSKGKKNYLYKPDKLEEDLSKYELPIIREATDNPFTFSSTLPYYYQTYSEWQAIHYDPMYSSFEYCTYGCNNMSNNNIYNKTELLFQDNQFDAAGTLLINLQTQEIKKYRGCIKKFNNLQQGPYRVIYVNSHLEPLLHDSLYSTGKGILIQYIDSTAHFDTLIKNKTIGLGVIYNGIILEKETREPIPFSMVTIEKNGEVVGGTLTDIDGKFALRIPPGNDVQIKFSCIGYSPLIYTNEQLAAQGNTLTIQLEGTLIELKEFVLQEVNISTQSNRLSSNASYEVLRSTPGVFSRDVTGYMDEEKIVGNVNGEADIVAAIVGGVPASFGNTTGGIVNLDKSKIGLGDDVNPEIILGANAIRSFFSDNAIWQPNLLTAENGKATCQIKFPENITSWDTYILAMHPKGLSGRSITHTKSYKPVVASLYLPNFVIEGDSFEIVNKVMNYTSIGLDTKNKLQLGETTLFELDSSFKDFFIRKNILFASPADSIKISFSTRLSNGYIDGEKRVIPVYKKGIQVAEGKMFPVWKNCSIAIDSVNQQTDLELEIFNGFDNLVTQEADYLLYHYLHSCNEQISSKLITAIAASALTNKGWKKDLYDLQIEQMIHLLQKNQNDQGGWGWWNKSKTNVFMSLKVCEALKFAEENGYEVKLRNSVSQSIPILLANSKQRDDTLAVIKIAGLYKVAKETVFDLKTIYTLTLPQNDYQKLMVMEIKQLYNQPVDMSDLMSLKKETLYGNYYWGTNSYALYDNANYMTSMALSILKRNQTSQDTLIKVLGYLLEKRINNHFSNTLVSAKLAIFFHDYVDSQSKTNPIVIINQKDTVQINNRFQKLVIPGNSTSLSILTNKLMYVGYSQQKSLPFDAVKDNNFQITTQWLQDGKEVKKLQSGNLATLHTNLIVKKDAQYMSFEIPIPAGCTYAEKPQSGYNYYEVHREYFKDRLVIYYENLPAGNYEINLQLECRFKGTYTINNSFIENMYFPQLNGYNALSMLRIK